MEFIELLFKSNITLEVMLLYWISWHLACRLVPRMLSLSLNEKLDSQCRLKREEGYSTVYCKMKK